MKKFFSLVLFMLATGVGFCQTNFLPGTIKKKSGETVSGYIDFRDWFANPTKISFKVDSLGDPKEYTLFDLDFFEIIGKERYVSARVKKDMRPVKLRDLSVMPAVTETEDQVFLRELFSNDKVGLYIYRDFKDHFYVRDGAGVFSELIYRMVMTDIGRAEVISTFRNQLLSYFPESRNNPKLVLALERLKYNESDLSSFFYKVTNTVPPVRNRIKPQFFIGTGALLSKLKYSGSTKLADHQFDLAVQPLFFAGVDFASRRNRGAFVVRAQFEFNQLKFSSSFLRKTFSTNSEQETYSLNMNNFKPSLNLLYNFWNQPNKKIYAGVGLTSVISRYSKNLFTRKDEATNYYSEQNDILVYQKSWFAVDGQAGIVVSKKFDISASYTILGSFSNTTSVNAKPTLIAFRGAFRF